MKNLAKSMPQKGITQFELVNYLLQNLYKWDLKPIEQLVLLQLAYHYNPTNKFVFPKQKTIAHKINVSERSVIRAIQSLVKVGLILVECNLSNKYAFASKLTAELSENEKIFEPDIVSSDNDKISSTTDKMSYPLIEQTKEPINEPTSVDDFKILKDYAIKHNAKNINAYINTLKKSGSDKQIIKDYKQAKANNKAMLEAAKQNQKDLKFAKQNAWQVPEGFFDNIRSQITKNPTSVKMQGLRKEDLLLEE